MMADDFSLLRLLPKVLRARDFRLYTEGGPSTGGRRRIVDLWQNGGAAVLGHTPPSLLRELKNTASRGLYAPFPHFLESRYFKALSAIFPGRNFRLYAAPPPELHDLAAEGSAALWRPFANPANPLALESGRPQESAPPVLIPVVPGIQGWRGGLPCGLCTLAIDPQYEKDHALPPGDFISPVLLAFAARGVYDLIAAAPERAKAPFPRIARALKNSPAGSPPWQRQGIYVALKQTPTPGQWEPVFRRFLEAGFLLPPVPGQPAILPGILSAGEEAQLAAAW